MPISLFSLPPHIRDSVIQQMTISDFICFQQSSMESFGAGKAVKTRFTVDNPTPNDSVQLYVKQTAKGLAIQFHKVYPIYKYELDKAFRTDLGDFPLRFEKCSVFIEENLSEDLCMALINFILHTNSSIASVSISQLNCSPDSLKSLAETNKVKCFYFHHLIPSEYLKVEIIRNMSYFTISSMPENDILRLDVANVLICNSNLTSITANQLLKGILGGMRRFKSCSIYTDQPLHSEIVMQGISILHSCRIHCNTEIFYAGAQNRLYRISIASTQFSINHVSELPSYIDNKDICKSQKKTFPVKRNLVAKRIVSKYVKNLRRRLNPY